MPFDGLTLAAVCSEARPLLTGGRIERIQQPENTAVIIRVRNHGQRARLFISAAAQAAGMRLTTGSFTNPAALPVFAAVLRKHLEGRRITALQQPGFERVIRLVVEGHDEIGLPDRKYLIAEFMGKHSNIILVDAASGAILDGIKRYTHAVSRFRQVLPGIPYKAPGNVKTDPGQLDIERYIALITDQPLDRKLFAAMQKKLEGLSLPLAREIVHRSGIDLDTRLEHCGVYELNRTWDHLQKVCRAVTGTAPRLAITYDSRGRALDFGPLEFTHRGDQFKSGAPNKIIDLFMTRRVKQQRLAAARNSLRSVIARTRRNRRRKARRAENTVQNRSRVDLYRTTGEVLTANLYQIEDGTREVTLENFYTGEPMKIKLDPRYSPAQNAQAYFKRYNKRKTALARAEREVKLLAAELRYLDELETSVEMAENLTDITEIRAEMITEGYLKEKTTRKKRRETRSESQPRRFTAPGGQTILVGRNNRQNDIVTFRHAAETDIWLHAREIPGAHVILRTGERTPDDADIEYAARVAAYYSRAREAGKADIDYTQRRHVKKPKGAKPGFVIYTHEKTIQVPTDHRDSPRGR